MQIEPDDAAQRRVRIRPEVQTVVDAVDEVPGGREARHDSPARPIVGLQADHMNLGLITRAAAAGDHEQPAVARDVDLEHDFRRVRPLEHEPVGRLRVTEPVEPHLTEVLRVLGRNSVGRRNPRIEKPITAPRDRCEFHPMNDI